MYRCTNSSLILLAVHALNLIFKCVNNVESVSTFN